MIFPQITFILLLPFYIRLFILTQSVIITAKEQYDKAELLLKHIPDELEKAEFHSNISLSYLSSTFGIKHGTKARVFLQT